MNSAERWVDDPDTGKVLDGKLVLASGTLMDAGCHHTGTKRACGGCYARLWLLFEDVEKLLAGATQLPAVVQARKLIDGVSQHMQREGAEARVGPPRKAVRK